MEIAPGRRFRYRRLEQVTVIRKLADEFRISDLARYTGLSYDCVLQIVLDNPSNPITNIIIALHRTFPGVEPEYR